MREAFWFYFLVVNAISFILMGVDKKKAIKGEYRIPEKTLFLFPVLGGAIGGTLGMCFFHHKTKHYYFRIGFPLLVLAWGYCICRLNIL
ncbi:MAG: DUF1294 domain-containing protein [Lachnospiraceae bacterium]|nr:DUF1294 domain-containing protein [Lachnospiraceae bacterium]